MANDNRNQRQSGGSRSSTSGSSGRARPWNVYYPRPYTINVDGRDEQRTDFMRVGSAFPLKEGKEGLTLEIQLPLSLEPGQRLIAMPRDDEGERR